MTMPLTSAKANHDFPWLRGARWVRELNDKHRR